MIGLNYFALNIGEVFLQAEQNLVRDNLFLIQKI